MWEGRQESVVYCIGTEQARQKHTYGQMYTPSRLMSWRWLITPHLIHHWDTSHTHTHTHACGYNSLPQFSHTHTHTCLPQETYRPPLSVYELIRLPQTGVRRGRDICCASRYGHVFHIINLLSNLPSALLTHPVILYSHLVTYHKTVCCSQPSSASFVTFLKFSGGSLL